MRAKVFYDSISMTVRISLVTDNGEIFFVPKDIWEDFVYHYNNGLNVYNTLLYKKIKPYKPASFRTNQTFAFYITCSGIAPNYLANKNTGIYKYREITEIEKEFKRRVVKFVDIKFQKTLKSK